MTMQTRVIILLLAALPSAAGAQSPVPHGIAFDVATVKPSATGQQPLVNFTLGPGDTYADTGGRFETKGISLLDYIRFAYKLSDGQVEILRSNAPEWISKDRFDVVAKSSASHPSKDDMRGMMQALLADRFALRVHDETRTLPVLALVQAKPGATALSIHPHTTSSPNCVPNPSLPSFGATPKLCGGLSSTGIPGAASRVRLSGTAISMTSLAAQLGQMGGFTRPILDATNLPGTYDMTLEWGPESATETIDETNREAYLQEALRQQLGLKLERRTAPFGILLIDHIDRQPTQN